MGLIYSSIIDGFVQKTRNFYAKNNDISLNVHFSSYSTCEMSIMKHGVTFEDVYKGISNVT